MDSRFETMGASELAALCRTLIFDTEDAAVFVGVDIWAFRFAVHRGRVPFVDYRGHRYFAVDDLQRYASGRRERILMSSPRNTRVPMTWVRKRLD